MAKKKNDVKEKYTFPAIFFKDGDGIGVHFPDLPGCLTCADDENEALQYAEEALGGWILSQEDMNVKIPEPTPFHGIKTEHGEAVVMVTVYTKLLREAENNRSINRTVTIPHRLNQLGIRAGVNFSNLLAEALRERLGV